MLILIAHVNVDSIWFLCQIGSCFHFNLDIFGSIFCHLIYKDRVGTGGRQERFIGRLGILSLYCCIKLKQHIADTGCCGSIFQVQGQHKTFTCMYRLRIGLKSGYNHPRHR